MPVSCEHSVEVSVRPEIAFALVDDLPRTKEWLPPCTALEKVTSGPNAVGDRLTYSFRQGGSSGIMEGQILARTPNEHLQCVYRDAQFEVLVDFRVESAPAGAKLTHVITISPKRLMGKLLSPLIRLGLKSQTRQAMANLKAILEK
jgi:hypothetical protein